MNDAAFRRFLDDISDCFIERNFELWHSRIILPFTIDAPSGRHVLSTPEAVLRNFNDYLRASDAMGLTLVDRRPISLVRATDDIWHGTYETRLVRGTQLATDAYVSTALLTLEDETFRMSTILNARGHEDWTRC